MPGGLKRAFGGLVLGLACVLPWSAARALEPINVTVEAAIVVGEGTVPSALRQRAFDRALRDAVLEVALRYLPPNPTEEEREALRKALEPEAARFVLTYRMEGSPERRPSEENPGSELYVMVVNATVDATRLRQALEQLGFLRAVGPRPSVALFVRLDARGGGAGASSGFGLGSLEEFIQQRLTDEGFVVVEPALYPAGPSAPRTAVELARGLGADLGVEVRILWTPLEANASGRSRGGISEVRLRSVRARDAVELAAARFDAPGYAPVPAAAFQRSIEALREQLASSLLFQLEQNLAAIEDTELPVRVRLTDLTGLSQVERVQQTLREVLGAEEARLTLLEPGTAELVVQSGLSAGALQERLVAAAYDGFLLEPAQMGTDRIDLRVVPLGGREEEPPPGRFPGANRRSRN